MWPYGESKKVDLLLTGSEIRDGRQVGMFRRLKKKLRLEYRQNLIADLCYDGQDVPRVWG